MVISLQSTNRIVTSVGRIHIEFDVADLNQILRTANEGLELYIAKRKTYYSWYSVEDVVRKNCRRSDLSSKFCQSTLKSQVLPIQLMILHYVLQHVISPRLAHRDEVTRLDMALLDRILEGGVLNVGYTILHHMLSTSCIAK